MKTLEQCAFNHPEITWDTCFDTVKCPLCEAMAELLKNEEEYHKIIYELETQNTATQAHLDKSLLIIELLNENPNRTN